MKPLAFTLVCALLGFAADAWAVSLSWSAVANPGNANDPSTGNIYGAVSQVYNIGTYDATNRQYAEFLNAVDPVGANPLGLFNSSMGIAPLGGIKFDSTNVPGSRYTSSAGAQNHPVNYVSWYDAIRFANWMNNGQGNSDTETGAYTLLGGTATPSNGTAITRNPGATIFLPNQSEWYKAAYYNPGNSSYFQYPTTSNIPPTQSSPTGLSNRANFRQAVGNPTDVGAYTGTTSPYGAFDMGGNVIQWVETLTNGTNRAARGASYNDPQDLMHSLFRLHTNPTVETSNIGFRVATVPETSTLALAAFGFISLAAWGWRRKRA